MTSGRVHDDEITLTHRFLFWTWTRSYRGSCTVWWHAGTRRRADTATEALLFEIWAERHGRGIGRRAARHAAGTVPISIEGGSITAASAAAS